jgi:Ca2+-binding RTX toxin-like protein
MAGADTLEGKDGADYVEGGADADTYVLQTGLTGIDTLVDSGSNTLQVDGKTVSGAFAQVAGMGGDIYYSADKSYQLRKAEGGVWRSSCARHAQNRKAPVRVTGALS